MDQYVLVWENTTGELETLAVCPVEDPNAADKVRTTLSNALSSITSDFGSFGYEGDIIRVTRQRIEE